MPRHWLARPNRPRSSRSARVPMCGLMHAQRLNTPRRPSPKSFLNQIFVSSQMGKSCVKKLNRWGFDTHADSISLPHNPLICSFSESFSPTSMKSAPDTASARNENSNHTSIHKIVSNNCPKSKLPSLGKITEC